MADQTVNIRLKINDEGDMRRRTQEAKEYNKEAEKFTKGPAAMSSMQYGQARGASGLTGASARDFASEQQGLGGLVRLYATVAANTYAATTAFNTLKSAMDFENITKGLDQMGATSGVALGSVAQNMVKITDGAISLRDAMKSVAQASSAGLTTKQMGDLATVATKASQALGIDASDAMSRLTRAITKLEPELIDELGLFTKLGKSTEDYARKIGKPVSALTDFERRQAFANAVLKEGLTTFESINIPANPYKQLEVSITNLTTAGLTLLNKFITPLASVLSQNTTLLGVVLAGIAAKLLTMAIPAITQWQDNLTKAAVLAKQKAEDINTSFGEKFYEKIQAKYDLPKLQKNLDDAQIAYKTSNKIFNDIDDQYQKSKIKNAADAAETISKADAAKKKPAFQQTASDRLAIQAAEKLNNEEVKRSLELEKQRNDALETRKKAQDSLNVSTNLYNAALDKADEKTGKFDLEAEARERISKRAGARAEKLNILAQVSSDTEAGGFTYAVDKLQKNIAQTRDLGAWGRFQTVVTGAFYAAATSVSIFASALSTAFGIVGVIITAFSLLDAALSTADKEISDLNTTLDMLNSTLTNSEAVYKKFGQTISSVAINARANSLQDLGDQAMQAADQYDAAVKKMGMFTGAKETFKGFLPGGFGIQANFGEKMSEDIVQQLKLIPEGPAKDELTKKLKSILKVARLDTDSIEKSFSKQTIFDITKVSKAAQDAIQPVAAITIKQSAALKDFKQSLEASGTAAQNLVNTLINNDPISQFGASLLQTSLKLGDIFKDPTTSLAALQDLMKDPKAFELLGVQLSDVKTLVPELEKYGKLVAQDTAKLQELKSNRDSLAKSIAAGGQSFGARQNSIDNLREIEEQIRTVELELKPNQISLNKLKDSIQGIATQGLENSLKLLGSSAKLAQEQAQIQTARGTLSGVTGAGISQATAKLNLQDLNIQQKQLNLTAELVNTMQANNILGQQQLLKQTEANIYLKATSEGRRSLSPEEQQSISQLAVNRKQLGDVQKLIANLSTPISELEKLLDQKVGLDVGARAVVVQAMATRRGQESQNLVFEEKQKQIIRQGGQGTLKETQDATQKLLETDIARKKTNLENLNLEAATKNGLDAQLVTAVQLAKTEVENAEDKLKLFAAEKEIQLIKYNLTNNTDKIARAGLQTALAQKLQQYETLKATIEDNRQTREKAKLQETIANNAKIDTKTREYNYNMAEAAYQLELNSIDNSNQLLQIVDKLALAQGAMLVYAEFDLKVRKQEVEYARALNQEEERYQKVLDDIETRKKQALAANKNAETESFAIEKTRAEQTSSRNRDLIEQTNTQKVALNLLDLELRRAELLTREDQKRLANLTEILNLQRELNDLKRTGLDYVSTQTLAEEQSAEIEANQLEMTIKRNQAQDKLNAAKTLKEQYKDSPELSLAFDSAARAAQDEFTQLEKVQKIQETIFFLKQKIAVIDNSYNQQAAIREQAYKNDVQQLDIRQQLLNAETEIFQINTKLQPYTDQQLKSQEYSFKLRQAEVQASKDLLEANRSKTEALKKLDRDEDVRRMIVTEQNTKISAEEELQFIAKKDAAEVYWDRQISLVALSNQARKEAIDLTYSLGARQEAYADIFKNTFIGMADALAEFAKTGKLNFKGLIDSMLSDLIRWELKQQSIALYQSLGGAKGIGGGIANFLGFGSSSPIDSSFAGVGQSPYAKGGAFDQGYPVHKFAMGGAFTNQIVDSPTLFKFAQGTGLMGEAGPEAIMPLKRDDNGNLGVRSQPSNVNVVVNNHTGQPAKTNETMDSRGNRTIEVIVGDVVAQQIATKNSPVQQSMSNTYGNRPALVRR
jgi:hypothetical protein